MSPGARRTRGEAANSRRRRCPEDRNCGTPNIGTRQRRVPITFSKGWGRREARSRVKVLVRGGTAVVGWVERRRDPTPSHANLDVGSRQELDATYGLSANVAMPARTRASNSSSVLPTGSLPPVLRCSFCKCVVVAVSYRSGFALTRAAMHQYHLRSRVPSPIKCKRCRKVTARRGPKLYDQAFTIGPAPISASTPVRPGPRSIRLSPIRGCSAAPDREV